MPIIESEVQKIIDNEKFSNNTILDKVSSIYMSDGYIVKFRTETQLQLVKKKKFNFIWAVLWTFLWGIGLLVYIFYYVSKDDEHVNITLDEKKNKSTSSVEELSKLSQLFKDNHLTQEEFEEQKKLILS